MKWRAGWRAPAAASFFITASVPKIAVAILLVRNARRHPRAGRRKDLGRSQASRSGERSASSTLRPLVARLSRHRRTAITREDHHDFSPDAQTHARSGGQWRRLGRAPYEGLATARPDCRPRWSPIVRSPKFVSFTLTLGRMVPPGASRDDFVSRQNLAGLEIRQSLDPTVPRGEIDPGEFE